MKKLFVILGLIISLNAQDVPPLSSILNQENLNCEEILKTGDTELIAQRGCCL